MEQRAARSGDDNEHAERRLRRSPGTRPCMCFKPGFCLTLEACHRPMRLSTGQCPHATLGPRSVSSFGDTAEGWSREPPLVPETVMKLEAVLKGHWDLYSTSTLPGVHQGTRRR